MSDPLTLPTQGIEMMPIAYVVEGTAQVMRIGHIAPVHSVILAVGDEDISKIKGMAELADIEASSPYLVPARYFLEWDARSAAGSDVGGPLIWNHRFNWDLSRFQKEAGITSEESIEAISVRTAFNKALQYQLADSHDLSVVASEYFNEAVADEVRARLDQAYSDARMDADYELECLREDLERKLSQAEEWKNEARVEVLRSRQQSILLAEKIAEYESHYDGAEEETVF